MSTLDRDLTFYRSETMRLRRLRRDVRQWVRDAYALGLVADDGAGREMLDELACIVSVARPKR